MSNLNVGQSHSASQTGHTDGDKAKSKSTEGRMPVGEHCRRISVDKLQSLELMAPSRQRAASDSADKVASATIPHESDQTSDIMEHIETRRPMFIDLGIPANREGTKILLQNNYDMIKHYLGDKVARDLQSQFASTDERGKPLPEIAEDIDIL